MKVALDTNRYVDLCKGVAETVALLEEAEETALPFVVLGELRAAFAHRRRQTKNEQILRRFLLKDDVNVIVADHLEGRSDKTVRTIVIKLGSIFSLASVAGLSRLATIIDWKSQASDHK